MLFSNVIAEGLKIVNKFIPDGEAKQRFQLEYTEKMNQLEIAYLEAQKQQNSDQAAINQEQAKSSDKFVSRARPFFMWVCGVAFAYHYVAQPFLAFSLASLGHNVQLPAFDMDALMSVALGMLGLGGFRTFEKVKGVTR